MCCSELGDILQQDCRGTGSGDTHPHPLSLNFVLCCKGEKMCVWEQDRQAAPNREPAALQPHFWPLLLLQARVLLLPVPKNSWWGHIFALHPAGRSGSIPYVVLNLLLLLLLSHKLKNIKLQPCRSRHLDALGKEKNPTFWHPGATLAFSNST